MSLLPLQVHLVLPPWLHDFVDPLALFPDSESQMDLALRLAQNNVEQATGGPFGAAVFTEAGRLVSVGVNRVVTQHCSVAHAEMMALMLAQRRMARFRLNDPDGCFTLASSAQPCSMCFGATLWAGIDRLLIGARKEDVESLSEFDEGPLPSDWVAELALRGIAVERDLLRERAREVFRRYQALGGSRY